ncbi:transmembrane amino acid transporter protein-domain-containing protein [Protomyces lactucae-debilis]|uniref:Transmembrane amino acid transporter protein-domain-containing protein n=1 Tax=Protomyces lactucae-debilis TaxID=2754530 RepID=A0A1Y2F4C8_PROLT|nr:transmembrane amino acid transporter protein-domain-containing protein [Protomyces lactucae-debilis]ORY77795.1 transmembrane amino acid transporter protein-domain-containing protein [Protomyces lactucae-debilis]
MTWIQVAALLGAEYISLAILSFPWSFSYLGIVGGILVTLVVQGIVIYTSMILFRFCEQNPGVKHICDIGQILFGGHKIFYELTMVGLLLNNLFIQALHCLTGSIMLNTLSGHTMCTIAFSGLIAIACAIATLPRTFAQISWLGWASALSILVSVICSMVFVGIQGEPNGYTAARGPVHWSASATTTDFISVFNAVLNISYTLIGQICLPSFIADMKKPKDFPKALYSVAVVEMILMLTCGIYFYTQAGQFTKAPAIGSLKGNYAKIAYGLGFPAVIVIGVLYASVLCQFLYMRFTKNTRHALDASAKGNTKKGWMIWTGLVFASWAVGFIIAECIPFFSDLLSVMSSLFDSFFGFIFWGVAYFHITPRHRWFKGKRGWLEGLFNILIIAIGVFILVVGTWASVASIIRSYSSGAVGSPFSCADNGVAV